MNYPTNTWQSYLIQGILNVAGNSVREISAFILRAGKNPMDSRKVAPE
jgi:hypothetical protein